MSSTNPSLLVNLPSAFFSQPELADLFKRMEAIGPLRRSSHDTPDQIAADLKWADNVIMWSWPDFSSIIDSISPLGYIGHIDLPQSLAKAELAAGIAVSLSKGGWSPAVAEMALTLTL